MPLVSSNSLSRLVSAVLETMVALVNDVACNSDPDSCTNAWIILGVRFGLKRAPKKIKYVSRLNSRYTSFSLMRHFVWQIGNFDTYATPSFCFFYDALYYSWKSNDAYQQGCVSDRRLVAYSFLDNLFHKCVSGHDWWFHSRHLSSSLESLQSFVWFWYSFVWLLALDVHSTKSR